MVETTRINPDPQAEWASAEDTKSDDLGVLHPWRIGLIVKAMQVKLVFDIIGTLSVGRFESTSETSPDIDLGPFKASGSGVSRNHLYIKLERDHVAVVDNSSLNGTQINGKRILPNQPYSLRHGDLLTLGALELQVEFLIDPLD